MLGMPQLDAQLRAAEPQEAADELIRLVRQFSSTHASLASDVALTSMALEGYAFHLTTRAVGERALNSSKPRQPAISNSILLPQHGRQS